MYTSEEIDDVLLRASRSMLIISDRIQDNFLYLYTKIYNDLKFKQRDIYILYKSLTDTKPFRADYDTYDALINVLISKCAEVDAYNSTYDTLNPNYVNIGGQGIEVVIEQNYVTPVRFAFTNEASPEITTWQASYADTFGNNPTLAIYLSNGSNSYSELTGVTPTLQFDGSNQLLSITYDIGVASTGYILIST